MTWHQEDGEVKPGVMGTAVLSDDGLYRYRLVRTWARTGGRRRRLMQFVMLNPSTADALTDDPTIRRCEGFARREGAEGLAVTNLYAWRSTDPRAMLALPYETAYGPDNSDFLSLAHDSAQSTGMPLVAAWGANARPEAIDRFLRLLRGWSDDPVLHCLGVTKAGQPRHPLMLRNDTPIERWATPSPVSS